MIATPVLLALGLQFASGWKSVKDIDPSIPIPKVNYQGKRSGDIDISLANIAKVKSAFNWQPKQSIEAGIASLVGHELGS